MLEFIAVSALVVVAGSFMIRRDFLFRPQNIIILYAMLCIVMSRFLVPYDIYQTQPDGLHFARSFYLYALGFFMLLAGMAAKPAMFPGKNARETISVVLNKNTLILLLTVYVFAGIALELYTFSVIGEVPLFSDDPFITKYVVQAVDEYRVYNPFYTLGMNLLTISSTVSLLMLIMHKKRSRWIFALIFLASLAGLVLTLTRGYIVYAAVMTVMALIYMGKVRPYKAVCAGVVIFIASIAMWYLWVAAESSPMHGVANNYFLNVKEFARILASLDDQGFEPVMGKTYLATAVSVLPSVINPIKDKFHLARVILGIFGDDPYISGTPRIGMVGESYLNFGVTGVVLVSFVFGLVVKKVDGIYCGIRDNIRGEKSLHMLYLSFVVLQPVVFFYESGSVALMYFIMMSILSAPIYFLTIKKSTLDKR